MGNKSSLKNESQKSKKVDVDTISAASEEQPAEKRENNSKIKAPSTSSSHLSFADKLLEGTPADFPLAKALYTEDKIFVDRYRAATTDNMESEESRRSNKIQAEAKKVESELENMQTISDLIVEKTTALQLMNQKVQKDYQFDNKEYSNQVNKLVKDAIKEFELLDRQYKTATKEEAAKLESSLVQAENQLKAQLSQLNEKTLTYSQNISLHRADIETKFQSEKRLFKLIESANQEFVNGLTKQTRSQSEVAAELREELEKKNLEDLATFKASIDEEEKDLLRIREKTLKEREEIESDIRKAKTEVALLQKAAEVRKAGLAKLEEESKKRVEETIIREQKAFTKKLQKCQEDEEEKLRNIKSMILGLEDKDSHIREIENGLELKLMIKSYASNKTIDVYDSAKDRMSEELKSEQIAFEALREKTRANIIATTNKQTAALLDEEQKSSKDRNSLLNEINNLKSEIFETQLKMLENIKITIERDSNISRELLESENNNFEKLQTLLRESMERVENDLDTLKQDSISRKTQFAENQKIFHDDLKSNLLDKEDSEIRTLREKLIASETKEFESRVAQIKKTEEEEADARLQARVAQEHKDQEQRRQAVIEQEEMEAQDRLVDRLEREELEAQERLDQMIEQEKQEAAERFARRIAEEEEQASSRCRKRLDRETKEASDRVEQRLKREQYEAEQRQKKALEAEEKAAKERLAKRLEDEEREAATRIKRQLQKEAKEAENRKRQMIEAENQAVKARQAEFLRSQLSEIEKIDIDLDSDS